MTPARSRSSVPCSSPDGSDTAAGAAEPMELAAPRRQLRHPVQVGPAVMTMNDNDRVLVTAPDGAIVDPEEHGLFVRDTRLVSRYELRLNGRAPILLSSAPIRFHSARFELTNETIRDADGEIPRQSLWLRIDRTIRGGVHEDLTLTNYAQRSVALRLEVTIEADFADIFDVRAGSHVPRGTIQTRWIAARRELRARYRSGAFERELLVRVARAPMEPQLANGRLVFAGSLPHRGRWRICLRWLPILERGEHPTVTPCHAVDEPLAERVRSLPPIELLTSNTGIAQVFARAVDDLEALRIADDPEGPSIAAAGLPWFATLFGRDALIAAWQALPAYPEFARGALERLAALQATDRDPERDMEPGKIPHELRHGELTVLGHLPYRPYYGTHDATSLFVVVLGALYDWLADPDLVERFLPHAEAAMRWIDESGDLDGDGLQEYATRSTRGYYNQGWKDAGDAILHADGRLAPLPLALCELQGYAYAAKQRLADLYERLDRAEDAARLRVEAARLAELVNERLWWEAEGTYYLGLDGEKRPIETVASNAGHLLTVGIVPPERARRVVRRLLGPDMWTGWGIRTLSAEHPAFNPFGYHTGSVWPHDNATIALGFARYGFRSEATRVARGLLEAAERFAGHRLPELFAGLERDRAGFPVRYLGTNVPQAWAAAAVLRLVTVLCGLEPRLERSGPCLYVDPALPGWLPELTVRSMRLGAGLVDLRIRGREVEVFANSSGYEIVVGPAPAAFGTRRV